MTQAGGLCVSHSAVAPNAKRRTIRVRKSGSQEVNQSVKQSERGPHRRPDDFTDEEVDDKAEKKEAKITQKQSQRKGLGCRCPPPW